MTATTWVGETPQAGRMMIFQQPERDILAYADIPPRRDSRAKNSRRVRGP